MNDLCGFEPNQYTTAPHQTEGWIEFRGSPDKAFARVADHAAIVDWLPLAQEITVTQPHPVAPGESTVGTARQITMKGGLTLVETVVYWNPPHCYAYDAQGEHVPLKNYIGLFVVEAAGDQGGRLILREYFEEMGPVKQALISHGGVEFFKQAFGNLAPLIGGTEYAMTTVSRV